MERSVSIYATPQELAEAMAGILTSQINNAKRSGVPANVAISGGDTPKLLFGLLAEKYSDSADWQFVHFFWADERCVPPEDPESNYGSVKRILFSKIKIPGSSVHRIRGEEEPAKEALRYSAEIRKILPSANNQPVFDHILLGIGNDGHTASIFPGREDLLESENICGMAVHPGTGQMRLTLTGRIINNAREITFMVTGEKKSHIVRHIICGEEQKEKYPAAMINPVNGKLNWMIDEAAASLIKKKTDPKT